MSRLEDPGIHLRRPEDELRERAERAEAALRDILERHRLAWSNCMAGGEVRLDEAKAWDIPASIARAALRGTT